MVTLEIPLTATGTEAATDQTTVSAEAERQKRRRPRWGLRTLGFLGLALLSLIVAATLGHYTFGTLGSLLFGLVGAIHSSAMGLRHLVDDEAFRMVVGRGPRR